MKAGLIIDGFFGPEERLKPEQWPAKGVLLCEEHRRRAHNAWTVSGFDDKAVGHLRAIRGHSFGGQTPGQIETCRDLSPCFHLAEPKLFAIHQDMDLLLSHSGEYSRGVHS